MEESHDVVHDYVLLDLAADAGQLDRPAIGSVGMVTLFEHCSHVMVTLFEQCSHVMPYGHPF